MAEEEKTGFYRDDEPSPPEVADVSWTASEFIAHHKDFGWYLGLAVSAVGLSALVYLLTRDVISVGVVILAAGLFGGYGARQPRQLQYKIDGQGIGIGAKYYRFDNFRSFSLIPEGAFNSIMFMPLKRFAPPLSIYYDPADEEKIMNVLVARLPFEQRRRDAVDALMHKIRF